MRRLAISIGLLLCLAMTPGILRADPPADPDGSHALAEFFFAQAHQLQRSAPDRESGQAASLPLLRAAAKLDPAEPRFAQAVADTLVAQGDHPDAIKALQDYLKLVNGRDQFAQVEVIDQGLARMQSADEKLRWLTQLVSMKQSVDAPVRSEAAFRAARLLLNHLQTDAAIAMLQEARADNKLNLPALRLLFDLTVDKATPVERVSSLLDMVAANPSDVWAASHMAQGLADIGMRNESLNWFSYTDQICLRVQQFPPDFIAGATSELVIADRPSKALDLLVGSSAAPGYLVQRPSDAEAWTVALAAAKLQSDENPGPGPALTAYNDLCNQAENAFQNNLADVRKAAGATDTDHHDISAPVQPLPVLTGDATLFQQNGNDDVKQKYISAVFTLAWFELLHKRSTPAAKPLVDALAALIPDTDPRLLRLHGWQHYIDGDNDSALREFGDPAVATDPMCALGSVLISLSNGNPTNAALQSAVSLVSKYPSGQVGATLYAFLMIPGKNPQVVPVPAGAPDGPIQARLNLFEQVQQGISPLFDFVNEPGNFYLVRVEPLETTYVYGEPVMARVTLDNIGGYPLSIGENGVLMNSVSFDAGLRGAQPQGLAAVAIANLGMRMVLAPNDTITTIVRLDADTLYPILQQTPEDIPMVFTIVTNYHGISTNPVQSINWIGGMRAASTILCERGPVPIGTPAQQAVLAAQLASPDGGDRVRALDAAGLWINKIHADASPSQPELAEGMQLPAAIRTALTDASDPVRAWAEYQLFNTSTGGAAVSAVNDLAQPSGYKPETAWIPRLLALIAASKADNSTWSIASQSPIAHPDKNDPIVSGFAKAISDRRALPPTTNPTAPGAGAAGN